MQWYSAFEQVSDVKRVLLFHPSPEPFLCYLCWKLHEVCLWCVEQMLWFWVGFESWLVYFVTEVTDTLTGVWSPVLFLPPSSCVYSLPFTLRRVEALSSFVCPFPSIHPYSHYDLQSKHHKQCWSCVICIMMIIKWEYQCSSSHMW